MTAVCTGNGSSDTHALVLNTGRPNPHPSAGNPYNTISRDDILAMIANPPSVPKEQGPWIIPSAYAAHDARSHAAQREHGQFYWMAADIDKGNASLEDISRAVDNTLGADIWRAIYATRSAAAGDRKWRILVPLSLPLTGLEYGAFQAAWFDGLEAAGLSMDRTLERAGQLVYLPNRGAHYEYQFAGQSLLAPRSHPMAARARLYQEVHKEAEGNAYKIEGRRSHLAAFRRKHSIQSLLKAYGYEQRPGTDHWRSPYSQSGSYSTQDRGDHWISLGHNDALANLGKATANGSRYGDAFDLFVHFTHSNDRSRAEEYAKLCLKEEDEALYGDASREHGESVWRNLERIGDKLGPRGHEKAIEESAQRLELLKTPEPEILDGDHEWNIEWPPGIIGEVAKHIYRSASRPVKQFAIAQALYLMAGMAGQRYNVEGSGLNLFMMIVGESGAGKGESRRNLEKVYRAIGKAAQDDANISEVYDNDIPASHPALTKLFSDAGTIRALYREDSDALLETLVNSQSGTNGDMLKNGLTEFWDKSSADGVVRGRRQSKREDSTGAVYGPSLTMGIDLQVEPFKRYLGNSAAITTGFASRFLYITRYGERMYSQENRGGDLDPQILDMLKTIWQGIRMNMNLKDAHLVQWEDRADFIKLDHDMTTRMRNKEPGCDILMRAHMQAAKVAALVAVGANHLHPIITKEGYEWATAFVMKGYDECLKWIAGGEAGAGESVRVAKMVRAIRDYANLKPNQRRTYCPKGIEHCGDIIPDRFLVKRLKNVGDFKGTDTGLGTEAVIRKTIEELVNQDLLVLTPAAKLVETRKVLIHGNISQKLYILGPSFDV